MTIEPTQITARRRRGAHARLVWPWLLALAPLLTLALAAGCARGTVSPPDTAPSPGRLMTARDVQALPRQAPDHRIAYGDDASQYGELRVPQGRGPHPVVVLIHGGCFKAAYDSADYMGAMGDALKVDGIATWNIEYRRIDQPGGAWPGTYLDVGRAVDHLRALAGPHGLDLGRLVLVGHSAGGHLAMWASARSRLPAASAVYTADPLPVRGVMNLAGPLDMTANIAGYEALCRDTVITGLLGGTPAAVPERYAHASAIRLLPLGIPQALVWGEHEEFVPLPLVKAYAQAAARAGDPVRLVVIPGVGHFEIASPRASTWPQVESAIRSLLDGRLPPAAATGTAAGAPSVRPDSVAMPTLQERTQMYYRYLEIPDRIQGLDLVRPHWMADGNSFWYAEGAPTNTAIYKVDPIAHTKAELFDTARLRGALTTLLGKTPPNDGLPFDRFSFVDDNERKVRFTLEEKVYILDLSSYSIAISGSEPSGLRPGSDEESARRWYRSVVGPYLSGRINEVASPDGQWVLGVDDYDLSLRSARDGTRRRLTSDGTAEYRWHILHPDSEEWDGPPALNNWSPNGRRIAVWRIDSRGVPRTPVVHWREPFGHPLHDQHRVKSIPEIDWSPAIIDSAELHVELHVGELDDDGAARWVKVDTGIEPSDLVAGVRWRPDGSALLFHRQDYWGKRLDLLAADPRTGRSRVVLTETAETFLDWQANARYDLLTFVDGGSRFIWRSNRDGWYDLYLYAIDGTLVRRLTAGPFEVTWPYAVDEEAGWIYFGAYGMGERPYDHYLHRVRLDGSEFQRLTSENGHPGPNGFSPSRQFFLLYSSTPTRPDVVELRRADGTLLQTLARENIDWLSDKLHWNPPEEFVVKAADGKTDLHGLLYNPGISTRRRSIRSCRPSMGIRATRFMPGVHGSVVRTGSRRLSPSSDSSPSWSRSGAPTEEDARFATWSTGTSDATRLKMTSLPSDSSRRSARTWI